MNKWYKKLVYLSIFFLLSGAIFFYLSSDITTSVGKVSCDAEKAMQFVYKCVNNKKFMSSAEAVLQKLTKMSQQCPSSEKYLYLRGQCYEGLARNQEALKDYVDANKVLPDDIVIKHALARIYYKGKNYTLALRHITEVIQQDKTGFSGLILRAKIYEQDRSINLAIKDYKEALKRMHVRSSCSRGDNSCYSPTEEEIYLAMLRLHLILGETNKAINILKEGIKWNPGSNKLLSKLRELNETRRSS